MKAIFIWKSDKPISSTSNKIKFVRGSTWWLEEKDKSTKSYNIVNYKLTPNGIVYLVEEKPVDWTCSDYLETVSIDYSVNKEIEQVGIWSRWISGVDISGMDEALGLADHVKLNLYGFSSGKKE
jgi:hypothetical protein